MAVMQSKQASTRGPRVEPYERDLPEAEPKVRENRLHGGPSILQAPLAPIDIRLGAVAPVLAALRASSPVSHGSQPSLSCNLSSDRNA